jgi:glycosyltransferase involved in cell wall biosynthesis
VVALDVGGTGSVVRDEENCLLVGLDGTVEAAVTAILRLLDNPALRDRLGAGCRRWREIYAHSWAQRVEVDVALIGQLAGNGRARGWTGGCCDGATDGNRVSRGKRTCQTISS